MCAGAVCNESLKEVCRSSLPPACYVSVYLSLCADLVTFVRADQMFKSYSINQAQLIGTTVYRVEAGAA